MWIRLTRLVAVVVAFVFLLFVPATSSAEDVIELKTGAKLRCKIVSVSSQVVVIRARIGTRTFTRKYPLSKVSAIVRDGKRRTFGKSKPSKNKSKKPGTKTDDGATRSKAQILALIKKEGSTAPEWYESTPLDYPKTLDLSWPQPPPKKGWNNRVNVGQYIWDITTVRLEVE